MTETEYLKAKIKMLEVDVAKWKYASSVRDQDLVRIQFELNDAQVKTAFTRAIVDRLKIERNSAMAWKRVWKEKAKRLRYKDLVASKLASDSMKKMQAEINFYQLAGRILLRRVNGEK